MIARRLRIEGHVQGVYFRANAQAAALRFGLTGWVRNRRDGSVACLVQGAADRLDGFEAWIRANPGLARVTRVTAAPATPVATDTFSILPTE
jgi:acylphosphatase